MKTSPVSTHRNYAATILGIFRRDYAQLRLTIHISTQSKTMKINTGTLVAIHNDIPTRERHAIEIMAYGAERISALGKCQLNNIRFIDDTNYAVLNLEAKHNKNR